jgi:iron complex outermembrane recepter protein
VSNIPGYRLQYHRPQGACLRIADCLVACLLISAPATWAEESARPAPATADLSQLPLEDLMNIEVTSVSKKAERVSDSAAAVYVVTQEDIRRSGATSIADALRMVPGMHVASVNSHMWAISSRGFNDRFANKLLVLIDGRSVYTPLFSGTWWDVQDTALEDIDRIEVIRGPGATMWGANAVNGVINIITKRAADAQGLMLTSDAGSGSRITGALRYGGVMGTNGHFRVYTKYLDRRDFLDASGDNADDSWNQSRTGFRVDRDISDTDSLTVHGDVYNGSGFQRIRGNSYVAPFEAPVIDNYQYAGSNVLARWTRTRSESSETALQVYYDRTDRQDIQHTEARNTWDLDFQRRFSPSTRRDVTWGLGYRLTWDDTANTAYATFDPSSKADHLLNAFVQEDLTLVEKKLRLTLGSKIEHNDYTGYEVQPNARLLWSPDEHHTLWTAVSRAVRTPTRGEEYSTLVLKILTPGSVTLPPGTPDWPIEVDFTNNPNLDSEKLTAYEMGYRFQPRNDLSFDLSAYYNFYRDIRTVEPGNPYAVMTPVPHLVVPYKWGNLATARTHGVELAANWELSRSWKLALGYSWLNMHMDQDPSSHDPYIKNYGGNSPTDMLNLRSYVNLQNNLSLDTMAYYVNSVPAHSVPSYVRLDMRIGWKPRPDWDLSLIAQNMFDSSHPEFGGTLSEIPMQVPQTMYLKLTREY